MSKDLIIHSKSEELFIALLENNKLLELHKEVNNPSFCVGDVYLGKVRKISQSLNAAFINIGALKDAFLHYQDLGINIKSFINLITLTNNKQEFDSELTSYQSNNIHKNGNINDVLKIGQTILVQITKESISNKGPRLTSEIAIAGRYLILIPFLNKISISQKIKDYKEKERLIAIIENIKPKNFGIIIRTVSQNKTAKILESDLIYLIKKWNHAIQNIIKKSSPLKIISENQKVSCILRDTFDNQFTSIVCDNQSLFKDICAYIYSIDPKKNNIVKYYNHQIPIFEKYGIDKQIKTSLGKNIPFAQGAYLIIEHTEAFHVIDVNSGMPQNNINKNSSLEINILAANEIARQIRLRDMGGIIVIDFIDMNLYEDKKALYEHFKKIMEKDRVKHKILPPSKFGLVQITRQRVKPEIKIMTNEPNPNNLNTEISAPLSHIYHIELILESIIKNKNHKKIYLHTHPFITAYLKYGFFSIRLKWLIRYKKWIFIIPRHSFRYLEYLIIDDKNRILYSYRN